MRGGLVASWRGNLTQGQKEDKRKYNKATDQIDHTDRIGPQTSFKGSLLRLLFGRLDLATALLKDPARQPKVTSQKRFPRGLKIHI